MLTASGVQRLALPGLIVLSLASVLAAGGPTKVSITESFENGYGPWTINSHIGGDVGGSGFDPGCDGTLEYEIGPSQDYAFAGDTSIETFVDGHCDDGTLWLVRPISLAAGTWSIEVDFLIHQEEETAFSVWEAKAFIGLTPPASQRDFTTAGFIADPGWTAYAHAATITTDRPTAAYVAVGIRVAWETFRTHWIDAVTISGIPPQDEPADLNFDGVVNGLDLALLLGSWGSCLTVDPCFADLNEDATVNGLDLAMLLTAWTSTR
jgi:Dockerin type I domain